MEAVRHPRSAICKQILRTFENRKICSELAPFCARVRRDCRNQVVGYVDSGCNLSLYYGLTLIVAGRHCDTIRILRALRISRWSLRSDFGVSFFERLI